MFNQHRALVIARTAGGASEQLLVANHLGKVVALPLRHGVAQLLHDAFGVQRLAGGVSGADALASPTAHASVEAHQVPAREVAQRVHPHLARLLHLLDALNRGHIRQVVRLVVGNHRRHKQVAYPIERERGEPGSNQHRVQPPPELVGAHRDALKGRRKRVAHERPYLRVVGARRIHKGRVPFQRDARRLQHIARQRYQQQQPNRKRVQWMMTDRRRLLHLPTP
ncbi:hypothetical protein HRbin15_02704 [bacterium HR15]|nr:hypothetical protein HRbin15_02704 [bacterium HR15]